MCKFWAKIIFISISLPLVSSHYVNNIVLVTTPKHNNNDTVFRVVNGVPAKLGEIPYQISFKGFTRKKVYRSFCGGCLIGTNKILSAAHCFVKKGNFCDRLCKKVKIKNLKRLYAVAANLLNAGVYKKDGEGSEQWRRIKRVAIPRGYWFPKNDIALVFTGKKFEFNGNVKAMPLASRNMDYGSIECVASGFGKTDRYDTAADVLMWANLKLIPKAKCSKLHRQKMHNFICTENSDTDVLQGDSGGPLICKNTGDPADKGDGVIVGVVSGARRRRGTRSHKTFLRG